MTREELIDVICDNVNEYTCKHYDCDGYEINCRKCAEEVLAEYEKQIRTKAIDDVLKRVREHYKFYKTMPSITLFEEMLEELKGE